MKETTVLNNISKLVDKMNYRSVYIEIHTANDSYTLEKGSNRKIGFVKKVKQNTKK